METLVHDLSIRIGHDDDSISSINIDFLLECSETFVVFGTEYNIDRIKITSGNWEEFYVSYANDSCEFESIKILKKHALKLYKKILQEQKNGKLKRWSFNGDFSDWYSNYFR